MKITNRKLRRVIREEIVRTRRRNKKMLSEGFLEMMKDVFIDPSGALLSGAGVGVDEDYLQKIATPDAWRLFKAMGGLGTDEDTVEEIFRKRSSDLPKLSKEFDDLRNALVEERGQISTYILQGIFAKKFLMGGGLNFLMKQMQDRDLVGWLRSDGMDDEADILERTLLGI